MDALWQKHPQTVRGLMEEVSRERKLAYTTIQTIVTRLAGKGLVERLIQDGQHWYAPKATRTDFLRSAWRSTFRQFLDRFGSEAIAAFAQEFGELDPQERKRLEAMLDHEE